MTIVLLSLFGLIVAFPATVFFFGDAILAHVRNTVQRARQESERQPSKGSAVAVQSRPGKG